MPGMYLHLPIVCSADDQEICLQAQRGCSQLVQRWMVSQKDAVCTTCAILWLCPACTHRLIVATLSSMMQMRSHGSEQPQAVEGCILAILGMIPSEYPGWPLQCFIITNRIPTPYDKLV